MDEYTIHGGSELPGMWTIRGRPEPYWPQGFYVGALGRNTRGYVVVVGGESHPLDGPTFADAAGQARAFLAGFAAAL
jgi:hypothetical protein